MLKAAFFLDVFCQREVWLQQGENVFGGEDNLVWASLLGELEGSGIAIPRGS